MSTVNPVPRRRSARLLWVAAGLAALVAILVLLLVLRPGGSPSATPTPSGAESPSTPVTASPEASPSTESAAPSPTKESTKPSPKASAPTQTADVPAPGPTTRSAVPLDKKAEVKPRLSAKVTRLTAVSGTAQGPGEVAGPSIRATISITNDTAKTVDLANTVVNLYYGKDESPASVLSGPGAKPLPTKVKVGDTASGVFVFSVPKDSRSDILITVDYSVKTPLVAFRGPGPRG